MNYSVLHEKTISKFKYVNVIHENKPNLDVLNATITKRNNVTKKIHFINI